MDSSFQLDKMRFVEKRGLVLVFLLFLCLKTVNTKTPTIKQPALLSGLVRSAENTKTTTDKPKSGSQTKHLTFSGDTVTYPGTLTDDQSASTDEKTKTTIRHEEHTIRVNRNTRQKFPKRTKDVKSRTKRRRHRSSSLAHSGLKRKSCPTRSSYVSKKTAIDIFGDTVDVYPVIHTANLALDQYFYESFCDIERCSCGGIDNKKFKSFCQTTHSYTYANIIKGGEIGWSYIKVRSGCSCVIQEKRKMGQSSMLDLLTNFNDNL